MSGAMFEVSPSPSGRRWRAAPDECGPAETFRCACPHPAFGHPLPEGEGRVNLELPQ
jgi:hypothetical protein